MKRLLAIGVIALGLLLMATACGDSTPTSGQADQGVSGGTDTGDSVDGPAVVAPVGPGISVAEALQSTLAGPLLVNGFVVTTADDTVYLAEALAESLPPQPGGATLIVEGLDLDVLDGLTSAQGITWSDQPVQILGDVADGVLTVSATTSG